MEVELALILFDFGVHSVVSYRVSQRIREIGIRMALGGDGRDALRLVLRRALRPEFRTVPVIMCARSEAWMPNHFRRNLPRKCGSSNWSCIQTRSNDPQQPLFVVEIKGRVT